jgi:glutamate-ammonia-ligase adenylyltransferase
MTDPADAHVARQLERLRAVRPDAWPGNADAMLRALALASDFAIDTLLRQPALLDVLIGGAAPLAPPVLTQENRADWPALLRRFRAAASTRLIWRDVAGLDDVDATLAGSTALAEQCLQIGLAALEDEFAQRFGRVRAPDGTVQRLVVFGLGKLGGGELNFSSDVDLVYAYPQDGESDGPRCARPPRYFARLGQQLAKLLDEATADGFCHRVDLRLRPFGNAGRGACRSRRWSRTSSAKAATGSAMPGRRRGPVAGDSEAWRSDSCRPCVPFVYARTSTTARSTACAR